MPCSETFKRKMVQRMTGPNAASAGALETTRKTAHRLEPGLNARVRLNIRPFMTVGDVKKKGAGVLRDKPKIKWGKDRGKGVESAPWYHVFNG